jgi:hypothetical protein
MSASSTTWPLRARSAWRTSATDTEPCDLYTSAGVVRVVKCGGLGWAGYAAGMDIHSEELCDVYRSAGVVRVVKCGGLGWAGYAAGMGIHSEELCDLYRSLIIVCYTFC